MEKLAQLEERKKHAKNFEARKAAMAEKEKKMITLTEQPGLLPFVTYKVNLSFSNHIVIVIALQSCMLSYKTTH